MSDPMAFGGGQFFEGIIGDLLKMIRTEGPINWEMARQTALAIATGGEPEANVDPTERIRLEELVHVADLHVADAVGGPVNASGRPLAVEPVTRTQWAWHTLEAWRPLMEAMATAWTPPEGESGEGGVEPTAGAPATGGGAAGGPGGGGPPAAGGDWGAGAGIGDVLGRWASAIGPTLIGVQFGATIGYLARRALGQYELPIPRPASERLLVVPGNGTAFASAWSLPADDMVLWICLSEAAHHHVLGRPHVAARLDGLLSGHASGFRADTSGIEERLHSLDPSDPSSLQAALGDPTALLGDLVTDEQRRLQAELRALVAVLEGWVDHVVDSIGHRLISSMSAMSEALRRHRVERGEQERFVERLFGLDLGQATFERGRNFVDGVVERAGEEGLARLWSSERTLPTPAEADAPGLWLERIDLPGD